MQYIITLKKILKSTACFGLFLFLLFAFSSNKARGQTIISTNFPVNNGNGFVTFNFTNNNAYAIVITNIGSVVNLATGNANVSGYYKPSGINGAPGAIIASNGWLLFGSATVASNGAGTVQPFFTSNLVIPAGATYGICVNSIAAGSTTGALAYSTLAAGTYTFPGAGAILTTGTNIGYAGAGVPNAPANTPRGFIGSVTFVTAVPCSGTPSPGATKSTVDSVCPGIPFTLSFSNPVSAGTTGITYQWQSSSTGAVGSFTNILNANSSSYTTSLTASNFYQVVVNCSGNSGTSTPKMVTLNPPNQCYCVPGQSSCALNDVITNVTFGGINNNSTCSTGPPTGYTNYSNLTPGTVIQGANNSFSVTANNGGTEYTGVWIDYNQDGTFSPSEFTAIGSGPGGTFTNNIAVPANALLGKTRMRVRLRYNIALTGTAACIGYNFGETEDYTVNIVPCVTITLTSQPTNTSTVCGGNASFNIAVSGSIPAYQWEYRISSVSPWLVVPNSPPYSGVNSPMLTITNASSAMNGYQYRSIVSGACTGADFSSAATLTVTPYIPSIYPATAVLCAGSSLQLFASPPPTTTTTASGTNLNIHIPDGDDVPTPTAATLAAGISNAITIAGIPAGAVITNISVKVNVTHTYIADLMLVVKAPNGNILNLSNLIGGQNNAGVNFTNTNFSGAAGLSALISGTSPGYTGTFKPDAAGPVGAFGIPSGPTGFIPNVTNFAGIGQGGPGSTANGTWTIAMYDAGPPDFGTLKDWSVSITWGVTPATAVFSPNTNLFLDAALTIPYAGTSVNSVYTNTSVSTTYNAVVSTVTCTANASIPVTVNTPAGGTPTLSNTSVCVGNNTFLKLSGTLTGGPGFVHSFQVKAPGATSFTNLITGGVYSFNNDTLKLSGVPLSFNGYQFRDSINTGANCGSVISSAATLSVNPIPVVTISAAPKLNLFPGLTTTLTASVSSATGPITYQWFRNGVPVLGAMSSTLVVKIDGVGVYSVKATAQGCSSADSTTTPQTITIGDSSGVTKLFIYPSPNNGKFQVRYFSDINNGSKNPAMLNVYDEKGTRVFSKNYGISSGYQQMNVDLGSHSSGIYRVELLNLNGDRIKTGSVFVF